MQKKKSTQQIIFSKKKQKTTIGHVKINLFPSCKINVLKKLSGLFFYIKQESIPSNRFTGLNTVLDR